MFNEIINNATKEYPFLKKQKNVKYIPHFHTETEIVFVLEGELIFTLGNSNFKIKKGDICIIPSRLIHNLFTETYSETFVMKLYPIIDSSNFLLEKYIFKNTDSSYKQLYEYVGSIMAENEHKKEYYKLAVNILAESICLFISREIKHKKIDEKVKLKLANENEFLNKVNEYLKSRFYEDVSLLDIADFFNYTKCYFCRFFKQTTGLTFWEYFTMYRLERSIEYIREFPNESVIATAEKSGFKNVHSFNNAFKKYYHCTPSEYRKTIK